MNDENKKDVDRWMERAREVLDDARLLVREERYPSAISRAYYAAFYAACALLASRGLESHKHTGVMSLFDREFVLTGEMERRHGKAFHDLFDARNRSDYALGVRPHEEEAKQALALAEELVTAVGARLGPG